MADRTITVDVQSNLREQTQEARNLNRELDRAGTQRPASRTGSRAADAALGASGGGTMGMARGTTGAGGRGDERDFARQAQGLGGLVHIYATFAANIYAVTAAFSALQKAADTTAMVQGADTLSARYGVSLKNVGKELQTISGQALSTADALQFASLGASAGVTQKQMTQLATVATGASKALGRDLNDAMQRIYRGAIKLEPELLDELGIMVKVDEASATYARSLGKTALQLSDVEKRQAFVNAVIEQGSRKFGEAAEIAANPYTKLVAAMRDLGQNTLEVVNTGVGPLVNLLSQSPTALVSVVTLLIGKLAKMAMPDILPKAEERFKKASNQLEFAAKSLKAANKDVAKAFEETSAFKFISSEDQTKLGKRVVETSRKLRDSLLTDIEKSDGTGKVKLSLDTENLRKELEISLTRAIKSAENIASRSGTTADVVAKKLKVASEASLQLELVKSLEGGLDQLADKELITGKARMAENIATVAVLKEQRDIKVAQLQHEGKHLQAIKAAYDGQKAISAELKKQADSYGKTGPTQVPSIAVRAASPVIAALKTAGTSLLGLLGRLGTYGAIISLAIEGTMEFAKALGWMSDTFDKVSNSYDKTKETLSVLSEGLLKLDKAKSLQDIFELKEGQLKLLADAAKQLEDLKINLDEANLKGTWLDKSIDWLKGLPIVPGKSGQQQYTSALTKTASKMSATGQLNLEPTRKELENLLVNQLPAWAADSERKVLSSMSFEDLVAKAQEFKDVSPQVQEWLVNLSNEISKAGKRSAESAATMDQASSSQKELTKLTKDYLNNLIPQTIQTRLLAEAGKGLVSSLSNLDAAAESLKGFNDDLFILADYTDEVGIKQLKSAQQALSLWDNALASGEVTQKQADEAKKRILAEYNSVQLMVDVVFKLRNTAESAALAAINAEVNMAKLNTQLRKLSYAESAFGGPTAATTRTRFDLEAKLIDQEKTALIEQQKYIQSFLKVKTGTINTQLGGETLNVDTALKTLTVKMEGLAATPGGLYDKQNAEALSQYEKLNAIYDSLYQAKIADLNLTGKLQILELKRRSAEEQRLELNKVIEDNRKKAAEGNIALSTAAYNSAKSYNDTLVNLIPDLAGINALELERFSIVNDMAQAMEKQTQAQNALNEARRSARQGGVIGQRAQEAIPGLETTLATATTDVNRITGTIEGRIATATATQTTARLNLVKTNLDAELSAQKLISESAIATNETRALASSRIVELTNLEYATKLKTLNVEIEKQQKAREIAIAAQDSTAATAAQEVLNTKLVEQKALELQHQKTITELKLQEANASMRLAEGTPGGMLTPEYWKSLGSYASSYFKQIEASSESVGATFVKGMEGAIDTISSGMMDLLSKNELSWKNFTTLLRSTFASLFRDLAAEFMKLAMKKAALSALAFIGFENGGIMTPNGPAKFEKGGVMGEYGPLTLHKYSNGGVASSPQLALFGEGSKNEAYVPLPDNRTIPVTLNGNSGGVSIGDTNISITINSSTGQAEVSTKESTDMAKLLAGSVKQVVQEEFIKQSRPGGLIYGMRR